jgi:F0F1-type ATP synthase membrane subunit c/vacuolar-type H+-ATPase subunit K
MCFMAGGAILCCGWMQGTIPPVFCDLAMAVKTEGRLPFFLIEGMGRTMGIMTGRALFFGNRFVLNFQPGN